MRKKFLWGRAVLSRVNVSVLYKHWFSTHEYIMLTAEACRGWGLCSCQCSIRGKIEKLHRLHYPTRKTSVWHKAQYISLSSENYKVFFSQLNFRCCRVVKSCCFKITCWISNYFLWSSLLKKYSPFKNAQTWNEHLYIPMKFFITKIFRLITRQSSSDLHCR